MFGFVFCFDKTSQCRWCFGTHRFCFVGRRSLQKLNFRLCFVFGCVYCCVYCLAFRWRFRCNPPRFFGPCVFRMFGCWSFKKLIFRLCFAFGRVCFWCLLFRRFRHFDATFHAFRAAYPSKCKLKVLWMMVNYAN